MKKETVKNQRNRRAPNRAAAARKDATINFLVSRASASAVAQGPLWAERGSEGSEEIARAFLVPVPTVQARITRGKKIGRPELKRGPDPSTASGPTAESP